MKSKTKQEIDAQIKGLELMKAGIPEYSMFGSPNHLIIDAQISILKGEEDLEDFDEGDWESMDEDNQVYRGAEDAVQWLDGDREEDLFDKSYIS
jgi:hypothetical protein